jgi:hypothetical protein
MIPAFDDGEGIKADRTACKLLEQGLRRCALFNYVLACVDAARFAAPASIEAKPEITFDNAVVHELAGNGGE